MSSRKSRLQELRESRDLSRRKVATRLGVSEKQLERWEKGTTPLKGFHLLALAAVYGVDVDEIEEVAA